MCLLLMRIRVTTYMSKGSIIIKDSRVRCLNISVWDSKYRFLESQGEYIIIHFGLIFLSNRTVLSLGAERCALILNIYKSFLRRFAIASKKSGGISLCWSNEVLNSFKDRSLPTLSSCFYNNWSTLFSRTTECAFYSSTYVKRFMCISRSRGISIYWV